MNKSILICLLLIATSGCSATQNQSSQSVKVIETRSFQDVIVLSKQKIAAYSSQNVLIVVDIDNTLLTSSHDLGGDIWYQWQRGQLNVKPTAEQKVKCLFEDSIALLYELSPMQLIEDTVPEHIQQWQDQGLTLFALTSRSPNTRAATIRELARAGFDLSKTALTSTTQKSFLLQEKLPREMTYMQGVMMTSGMDKGKMLTYILQKAQRHFDAILFVDDSQTNVDNLYAEFSARADTDMTIFHYTKVEEDRIKAQGSILSQNQADQMAQQWQQLNQILNNIFPARNIPTCMGQ
jgi:FMN phosphatase YigB (HAD superfamily)